MSVTLYPNKFYIGNLETLWSTFLTALEEGPGLIVDMDQTVKLGMFFYDEAPRDMEKAFAGSDGRYILCSEAKQIGELLKKKIKIHEHRQKELEKMDPKTYAYYKTNYFHRFPVEDEELQKWRKLADFMIDSSGYRVK